ncbi:MAG: tRNA (N6-isopentenyl adenosine(37)-C2)-methylthiotransferase MiaB [Gammaproteobacteria bacterium]|nr:tRNA (N6-isopentenyl adenosine(37)-C2)-methylthiotransferase MiaB [Gammaproteobacteria bacterium]
MTDATAQKKVFVQTWGCQMNEYDSSKMADVLGKERNFVQVENAEEADVILLNTCSIREKAQEKVFSQLGRWKPLKKKNPDLVIGVGGCVASQEGEAIRERAPYVDMVFGPQTLHRLPELYDSVKTDRKPAVDISFPEIEKFDRLPEPRAEGPCAFVSIMEGCSKYCTFCVVPYTRGEEVSRPLDDVLLECAQLAQKGVREINLLGQNVNAYRGETDDGDVADLALLINYVAAIDGIDRIRFTTSHPVEFSDSLIQAFAEVPELANFVHLPVQAGSDNVLAAMKRGHNCQYYIDKINKLKEVRPDIGISSDFIVAYPLETDEDFEATMDLIETIRFDQSFSFIFSPRPGTPADLLANDRIPEEVKKARLARLQARIREFQAEYSEAMVGTVQRVLVEKVSKQNMMQLSGRTENLRWVHFDAPARLVGEFVDVYITEATTNALRGRVVTDETAIA